VGYGVPALLAGLALGDTWTWNGSAWTKQSPATSPSVRVDPAMAYDTASGDVLFGGQGLRIHGL
jgi:hypothetical protein